MASEHTVHEDGTIDYVGNDLVEVGDGITYRELQDTMFYGLEFRYDPQIPIWTVLDEVSTYFEERDLSHIYIQSISTVENDSDFILEIVYVN